MVAASGGEALVKVLRGEVSVKICEYLSSLLMPCRMPCLVGGYRATNRLLWLVLTPEV